MKLTFVAVSAPALGQVQRFAREYHAKYPEQALDCCTYYVAETFPLSGEKLREMKENIASSDAAVMDLMGASQKFVLDCSEALEQCKGMRIIIGNNCRNYNRLGSFSMEKMGAMMSKKKEDPEEGPDGSAEVEEPPKKQSASKMMHMMRRMAIIMGTAVPVGMMKDMKNLFVLVDYWQQASEQDMDSFMHLLLRRYFKQTFLPKEQPCTMEYGIYLKNPMTGRTFDTLKQYEKTYPLQKNRPNVGLLFYGHTYPNDFSPVVKALYQNLSRDCNIVPVAFSQNEDKDLKTLDAYMNGPVKMDALINIMPFRLGAGPMGGDADAAVEILKKANVPYFKPVSLTKMTKEEWQEASAVAPGEFLISIMLPELDGGIHTYPIAIMDKEEPGENTTAISHIAVMPERVNSLCDRVRKYMALRKKANKDKKLAVICYNYPPGEGNVFGGAFLDSLESVSVLLNGLKQAGYTVEERTAEELKKYFITHCNDPQWNNPTGDAFGLTLGNVFVGLQPLRTGDYHDRTAGPGQDYVQFYDYLKQEFKADAMLHFGTHGTLEFLPGKDNGVTADCWPDRLVGDVPHFYYYYMGNPSEAVIAKRRSNATLISYAAPDLKEAGLNEECAELKDLISQYRGSLNQNPEQADDLLQEIRTKAQKLGMLPTASADDPVLDLDKVESTLYDYETALIPDGLHVLDQNELKGILWALDGKYMETAPGGDVLHNPEVLPAGRNLVQFDPRKVPTKVAYARGEEAARQTLERYYREHGTYPTGTAVLLWGLETCRSQGETLGQIGYYLGLRRAKREMSYDPALEIIPLSELGRPRVDCVIQICGFFRDMYPSLMDDLNEMFRQLDELHEPADRSGFAANTEARYQKLLAEGYEPVEARELARSRIFGPKEGEYGSSLTDTVRSGRWKEETELADSFTDSLSYVYTNRRKGVPVKHLLRQAYTSVELISQVRNNVEYELVDLDHYFEFYGGLAKSVELARGEKADMYVADTTGKDVKVTGVEESLQRGIQTRLLNPAWIQGQLQHGYHGVAQLNKRFENIVGFAATTDAVPDTTFHSLEQTYVENEELKNLMQEQNPWAYHGMLNRLVEAENRGYWEATEEEKEALRRAYLETEGRLE